MSTTHKRTDTRWWKEPPPPPAAPRQAAEPPSDAAQFAALAAVVLAVVGLIIEVQPVSLLTGPGTLYIGLALAAGGVILAFGVHSRTWVRAVCVVIVVLCLYNTIQAERELGHIRQQIQQQLQGP